MCAIRGHKDLDVWKKSMAFVTTIYKVTQDFPKEEIYGITNQMRRAAVSIPSNISEGASRGYEKEFIQFLHIALGSLSELETQILISRNLDFISEIGYQTIGDGQRSWSNLKWAHSFYEEVTVSSVTN